MNMNRYQSDLRHCRWTCRSDQRRLFHHHRLDAGCSCSCGSGIGCTSSWLSSATASSQEKLQLLSKNPKVESAFAFVSFPRPPHLQSAFTGHCAVNADDMFSTFLVFLLLLLGTVIAKAKKKRLRDVSSFHGQIFFQIIEQEQPVVMVEEDGAVALGRAPEEVLHITDAEEEEQAPVLDEGDEVEEEEAPALDEGGIEVEGNEDDNDSIFRGMFDDNGDLFEDFDDWIVEDDDDDESNVVFAFDDEGRLYHGGDDFYIHMNALLLDEFLHRHVVEASPHVVACVPDELEDSDGEDGMILIPNDTGN